eukprot:504786-Rhodomonas_salina.2
MAIKASGENNAEIESIARAATVEVLRTMVNDISQQVATQQGAAGESNKSSSGEAKQDDGQARTSYSAEKAEQGAGAQSSCNSSTQANGGEGKADGESNNVADELEAAKAKLAVMERQNTDLQKNLETAKKVAVHEASERQRAENEKNQALQVNQKPASGCCTVC